MDYVKYIDFPEIPQHLIPSYEEIISMPVLGIVSSGKYKINAKYDGRECPKELAEWVHQNIPINIKMGPIFLLIYENVDPHTDYKIDSPDSNTFNYIINLGGENIKTTFYDDAMNETKTYKLESHRWIRFHAEYKHSVHGDFSDMPRIFLRFKSDQDVL